MKAMARLLEHGYINAPAYEVKEDLAHFVYHAAASDGFALLCFISFSMALRELVKLQEQAVSQLAASINVIQNLPVSRSLAQRSSRTA